MTEIREKSRIIRSDVTPEECKKIERVLRKNNISYFERWKSGKGFLKFLDNKAERCDIYIHMDSYEEAVKALEQNA